MPRRVRIKTQPALETRAIEEAFGGKFIAGNKVKLLWRGADAFQSILASAMGATEVICLQFYIFRDDETGKALADVLMRKARGGVAVYVIYDHLGSFGTPRAFWDKLKAAGVKVRASRPFEWASPWKYSSRDHRKLLVIDGHIAFTGGLNIANEYRPRRFQIIESWRDTGLTIRGPAAGALLETFKRSWARWGEQSINYTPKRMDEEGDLPAMPIFAQSIRSRRRMRKLFYHSMDAAQSSIALTTAYFTPSTRMLQCIERAARRGVRVRLIVPETSDVAAAHYAGRRHFERLLRAGVEIYLYQGRMMHAKTYIFDGLWSIVGSANLGFRSFLWNDEGNIGIMDIGFAGELGAIFEEDVQHSLRLDLEGWLARPFIEKAYERFFSIFTRRL